MHRHISSFTERSLFLVLGIVLFLSLVACPPRRDVKDIDVTAKTTYSGVVNGKALEVDVVATFNTGRGGSSTCRFKQLPEFFNPATLGTQT